LLAVAGLTLAILLALVAVGSRSRAFVVLSEIAVALTLVIVVVALRRLWLYEQAFGLTMLRLYSSLLAAWIGAAFVLLGLLMARGGGRSWFLPASVGLGLAGVLALNVVNPEALVVRHNVAHAEHGAGFDAGYATRLSADAVPALVAALPRLDEATRQQVLTGLCAARPRPGSWLSYNGGVDTADEARNRACR